MGHRTARGEIHGTVFSFHLMRTQSFIIAVFVEESFSAERINSRNSRRYSVPSSPSRAKRSANAKVELPLCSESRSIIPNAATPAVNLKSLLARLKGDPELTTGIAINLLTSSSGSLYRSLIVISSVDATVNVEGC